MIDSQVYFSLDCYATTPIPSILFEKYLHDNGIDTNGIGDILNDDAAALISLAIGEGSTESGINGIRDLAGIEAFTSLESLTVLYELLEGSLYLSKNTALTYLNLEGNYLTSLHLSENTALTYLDCNNNQLINLDISKNTALTYLDCNNNQLTSLDVSTNTTLTSLYCRNNNLMSLNIKNGNNNIISSFSALNNPDLRCINSDDPSINKVALGGSNMIDSHIYFSLDCYATRPIPSATFEKYLHDNGFDTNGITGNILKDDAVAVTNLTIGEIRADRIAEIGDFAGIEALTSLASLIILYESLEGSLDLSKNTALTSLNLKGNSLTSLNVANGNNSNFRDPSDTNNPISSNFKVTGNLNLRCIQVDDTNYSTVNWTNKDRFAFYRMDCTTTSNNTSDTTPNFGTATIANQSYTVGMEGYLSLPVATGGNGNLIYTLSPDLPDGLVFFGTSAFDSSSGSFIGSTPTATAIMTEYTLTATDTDSSNTDNLTFYVTVNAAADTTPTVSVLPGLGGLEGELSYGDIIIDGFGDETPVFTLTASGGEAAPNWATVDGNRVRVLLPFDVVNASDPIPTLITLTITATSASHTATNSFDVKVANYDEDILRLTAAGQEFFSASNVINLPVGETFTKDFAPLFSNNLTMITVHNTNSITSTVSGSTITVIGDGSNGLGKNDVPYTVTDGTTTLSPIIYYNLVAPDTALTTDIPDPNFEQALIDLGHDSGEIDRVVLTANISGITSLDLTIRNGTDYSPRIRDLSGIQAFTSLTRKIHQKIGIMGVKRYL